MSLRINTNVEAFRAYRYLTMNSDALAQSQQRLASGLRINRTADDPAGKIIAQRLGNQVSGIDGALRSLTEARSLADTGENAMLQISSILSRLRDLKVQYDDSSTSASERAALTAEALQLSAEVSAIGNDTNYQTIALLTGTTTLTFQSGPDTGNVITFGVTPVFAAADVDPAAFDLTTATLANIDTAIQRAGVDQIRFASFQARVGRAMAQLDVYQENLRASLSSIQDVDMAKETVNLTKLQILQQTGISMLAQANFSPQSVLALLQ